MRKLMVSMCFLAVLSLTGGAQALMLTFDDAFTPSVDDNAVAPLSNGYGGFDWNDVDVINSSIPISGIAVNGYSNGTVSPSNVALTAFGRPGTMSSDTPFTFNSAYLNGAWAYDLSVRVQGWRDNSLIYDTTVVVGSYSPTFCTFNYLNVDRLIFSTSGGINAGYSPQLPPGPITPDGPRQVVIDNLTINGPISSVPEPTSLLLLGLGIAGAAFRRVLR